MMSQHFIIDNDRKTYFFSILKARLIYIGDEYLLIKNFLVAHDTFLLLDVRWTDPNLFYS